MALTVERLADLINTGEGERVEFKRSTAELDGALQTVCAFLNSGQGGWVLFGVSNSGKIVGQDVSDDTLKKIANALRSRIDPSGPVHIDRIELSNGRAVAVVEAEAASGLYYVDGQPFERVASTTRRMTATIHQNRLLQHLHSSDRWEIQPAASMTIDDLDAAEIVRTIEESIRRQRMGEPNTRDIRSLLLGMRLYDGETLLNAAVVLFGRPEALPIRYPQCLLRLARFRGVHANEFVDNRQEIGNIFSLLTHADRFLRDHLPIAGRIVPNLFERIDDPLYPPEALREALINAFAHRDYRAGGGAVSIGIYDDRLEITSTGPLQFGLLPEDLLKPHLSRPWNPTIADVLYRRGIIENWGRGTIRMVELARAAGMPDPEIDANRHCVTIRFNVARYVAPSRVSHDLSPLQQSILQALSETGPSSLAQLAGELGGHIHRRTLQDNLQILRSFGLVELHGGGPASFRWRLSPLQNVVSEV